MKKYTINYRIRLSPQTYSQQIEAYNFAEAELKFLEEMQEEDSWIITQITLMS